MKFRTGDPERDRALDQALSERLQTWERTQPRASWKPWGLLILAIVLFWPSVIALAIVATTAKPSPVEWGVAVLLPLLFICSVADWVHVYLAEKQPAR